MAVEELSLTVLTDWRNPSASLPGKKVVAEMLRQYLSGEPVYIRITSDPKRSKAVARLVLSDENIQDLLHGSHQNHYYRSPRRERIEPIPENVDESLMGQVGLFGSAVWDGRKNRVNSISGWNTTWLKGHEGGTVWSYEAPETPAVEVLDKLGREIKVGDFISYILYHFDNSHNAAGIYYGKVTKIANDGTVWAKNIKLSETDRIAEKAIKDNSLIVIMSKDLMDKLMMARLSIL